MEKHGNSDKSLGVVFKLISKGELRKVIGCEKRVMFSLSEALVLSHEGAPAPLWEPYLAHLFRPIKPMVLFGRDASLQPRIPVGDAVWFGWKDFDLGWVGLGWVVLCGGGLCCVGLGWIELNLVGFN